MESSENHWLYDLSTAPASWHIESDEIDEDLLLDPETPLYRGDVVPRRRLHARLVEAHGGIIAARELTAGGIAPEQIRLLRDFGSLVRIRKGWYALPVTAPLHVLAWRIGGPLACISALVHHGLLAASDLADDEGLHVCRQANGSRRLSALGVTAAAADLGVPALGRAPVLHWSATASRSGNRLAVSPEVALEQARHCRPLLTRRAQERAMEPPGTTPAPSGSAPPSASR